MAIAMSDSVTARRAARTAQTRAFAFAAAQARASCPVAPMRSAPVSMGDDTSGVRSAMLRVTRVVRSTCSEAPNNNGVWRERPRGARQRLSPRIHARRGCAAAAPRPRERCAVLRAAAEAAAARRLQRPTCGTRRRRGAPRPRRRRCGPGGRCSRRTCTTRLKTSAATRVSAMKRTQQTRVSAQPPSALPRSDAPCANSSAAEKPSGGSSCGVDAIGAEG